MKRALIFLFKDGDKEVSQIQFLEPEEALKMHSEEKIWLAPPQFYELSRLAAFESYQDLKNFSQERAENFSVEVWFPVQYLLKGNKSCNLQIHNSYSEVCYTFQMVRLLFTQVISLMHLLRYFEPFSSRKYLSLNLRVSNSNDLQVMISTQLIPIMKE